MAATGKPLRLRASALVYTIAICALVGLILSGMVLLSGYAKLGSDGIYFSELARDNMESGRNKILYGKEPVFGSFSGTLFGSAIDSYYVESRPWGMYGLMQATGVHGPARVSEGILFGALPEGVFSASLFLADRNKALFLAGETRLRGKVYLPEAGLRAGFVGRAGYTGGTLHEGEKAQSKGLSPAYNYDLLEDSRRRMRAMQTDGHTGSWVLKRGDSLSADWSSEPLEIRSSQALTLENIYLSGNIVVTAPEIRVSKTARLEDVLLFAGGISIESGFEGRIQAFAVDSIVVEPGVWLRYPSALLLSPFAYPGTIELQKDALVEGIILCDPGFCSDTIRNESLTTIAAGAKVYGNVFVPLNLDMQGSVFGNVITNKFLLRTPGSVYENHILDATISSEELSKTYAMALIQEKPFACREILRLKSFGK